MVDADNILITVFVVRKLCDYGPQACCERRASAGESLPFAKMTLALFPTGTATVRGKVPQASATGKSIGLAG